MIAGKVGLGMPLLQINNKGVIKNNNRAALWLYGGGWKSGTIRYNLWGQWIDKTEQQREQITIQEKLHFLLISCEELELLFKVPYKFRNSEISSSSTILLIKLSTNEVHR